MSILLGPLSETISNVSWRDSALAGDQIAGAGSMPAPASAVIDFKNWRRFIWWTLRCERCLAEETARVMPDSGAACCAAASYCGACEIVCGRQSEAAPPIAVCIQLTARCLLIRQSFAGWN